MFSETTIVDAATVLAYSETEFRVTSQGRQFVLRIGEYSPSLLSLHAEHGVSSSSFITACNPFSQVLTDEVNRERQANLASVLGTLGLRWYIGEGQHPESTWPAEPSFLVLGVDLAGAQALGNRFEQNAVIWCDADAIPQLVMLR